MCFMEREKKVKSLSQTSSIWMEKSKKAETEFNLIFCSFLCNRFMTFEKKLLTVFLKHFKDLDETFIFLLFDTCYGTISFLMDGD